MLSFVPPVLLLAQALTVEPSIGDETVQDPLVPAQSGLAQCYDPDATGRSCQSIAAYHRGRDGGWSKITTILADPNLALTLDIAMPVAVRDGAVCGTMRREHVLGAKLRMLDRPVPADRALPVLAQIADAMAAVIDREVCTRYIPAAGGLIARPRISGVDATIPDQRVIWVRADAGYRVQRRGGAQP